MSGWSADVRRDERGAVSRRLDLGELLFGEPSVVPGVGSGRVSRARLAEVLAELVGLPRVLTVDGRSVGREGLPAQLPQTDTRPEGSTLVDRVARELTRMGFADVVPDSTCSRLESDIFRVEWWNRSKSVGLGDVQRLYGSAAARRRRLMVVTENSATRPARAFADDAGVYVFVVDPGDRRLAACNDLAREVVLDESTWLPARGLVDRSPV
ncbi:restriction endonuclease [Kitasatospora sp. NBC_01250]|uniref:restriction endonuclease n=1 Tax=Kitasatospora sp. NBC_01250 TaxID=2903571 RepID=UPI002E2F396D|nr:restriction endonuclease [Kitasatospora sp. NBC_01250]